MLSKLIKIGDTWVIPLPKDALDYLGLEDGAEVSIHLDREGRQIVISPATPLPIIAGVDETFAQQVSDFIKKYSSALEALSKV